MPYLIDAQLNQSTPTLRLIDAMTGEERLTWKSTEPQKGLQSLFKKLLLLSCADQLYLSQRASMTTFGEECLHCHRCPDQDQGYPPY